MGKKEKRDYKVKCDLSGAIYFASECRLRWDGLFVHKSLWSPRNPQDKIKIHTEENRPPIVRPEAEPTFIGPTEVTAEDL
jgi:hypothetical protein